MSSIKNGRPTMMPGRPTRTHLGLPAGACAPCEARRIGLCEVLDDDDLAILAGIAQRIVVEPGRVFIQEGDPARHFFNINHGTVRLFKALPDGRRQITGFMAAGDFLGLAVAADYAFSAEALDPVQVCRFDRPVLRAMFGRFPALERRLLDVAAHELVVAQEQMLLLGRKTAAERLASFLVAWSERDHRCSGQSSTFGLPMTRADLADYLGLTVETVSRTISGFRRSGLIDLPTPQDVVIRVRARLEAIAAGETP